MKSFMSAALQNTEVPKTATECNSCNTNVVKTTGQESNQPAPNEAPVETSKPAPSPEVQKAVVVMQGPLGAAITESLNKALSKKNNQSPVQIPSVGTESLIHNHVQANGQIKDPKTFVAKINKSVGLLPSVTEDNTLINTFVDCASKVNDIEFVMVGKVEEDANSSQVPQKSMIYTTNSDGTPSLEEYAVESVQVVVTYSKRPRNWSL